MLSEKLRKLYKGFQNPGMAVPAPSEYDRGFNEALDLAIGLVTASEQPVMVSLEQCISAAGQACDDLDWAMGDPWEDDLPALVKAVLDAAGVKYVD